MLSTIIQHNSTVLAIPGHKGSYKQLLGFTDLEDSNDLFIVDLNVCTLCSKREKKDEKIAARKKYFFLVVT